MNNQRNREKKWLLFILIILSIGINIYARLYTLFLPNIDKVAQEEVYNDRKNKLYKEISSLYPQITEKDKGKILDIGFKASIKEEKKEIRDAIVKRSRELKAHFQDERGWTYLLEVDPYRWFRRVESFLNTGHFGTLRINNREYDKLMFAPLGSEIEPLKIHFYIGAYFYKFLHFFNDELSLMNYLSLLPVALSAIMVIAIFSTSLLLGISYLGSFIASLVIGLNLYVFARSSFGWFDTDIYNIFLPLIITSTLAYSFKGEQPKHRIFLCLSAVLIGVYSGIWSIWWFIFYILLVSLFLYKLDIICYDHKTNLSGKLKESLFSLFLFVALAYLSVFFISGIGAIKKSFSEPFSYFFLRKSLALDNLWPNLAYTVSELRPFELKFLSDGVGGSFILFGGLIGMLLLIIFKKFLLEFKEKNFLSFVLIVWTLVMIVLTNFARRFIIFLVVPIGISFAVFLDILRNFIYQRQNRIFFLKKINKKIFSLFLASAFLTVSFIPLYNLRELRLFPILNDSWWNMLMKIKEATPEEAVIIANWDHGDFIMSIGRRATIQDAHWQYTPTPYWTARALLTDNEQEAVGILRMLTSGANQAFEEVAKALGQDKFTSLMLINKMILLERDESYALLGKYLSDKAAIDKILKFMYGPPPPAYLLVYNDMLKVMPSSSAIANWDFERLDLWQNFAKLNKNDFINYAEEKFGYEKEYSALTYESLRQMRENEILAWLSRDTCGFYNYYAETVPKENEKIILFDNGLAVDRERLRAYFRDDLYATWIVPRHLTFITKKSIKEKTNEEGNERLSVIFSEDDNRYKAILLESPLARSLFARLYFMDGRGSKHFKLIHHEEKKEVGINIYLYRIDW